jgi:hypothetical protein
MIRNARRVIIDAGAPRPSTKSVAAIAHLTTSEDESVEIGEIKGPVGAAPGHASRDQSPGPMSTSAADTPSSAGYS